MDGTGLDMALLACAVLFGGLLLERVLVAYRVRRYFQVGFPLGPRLVPIKALPEPDEGETATVRWARDGNEVLFWSGNRRAPMGLHGRVLLIGPPGRVAVDVRWSPPLSPILAAVWLAGLGLFRGEGWLTVPVGSLMAGGLVLVYWSSAVTAARELRWAFVKGDE